MRVIHDPAFILCGVMDRIIAEDAIKQHLYAKFQIVHLEKLRYGVRLDCPIAVSELRDALEAFDATNAEYTQLEVLALLTRVGEWLSAHQATTRLKQYALASERR